MACRPRPTRVSLSTFVCMGAVLACTAAASAFAQDAPPKKPAPTPAPVAAPATEGGKAPLSKATFDALMPANSLLFVGVDNLDQLRADWAASAWGKLYADPANEAVRAGAAQVVAALVEKSQKELGFDVVETFQWITGRVGFAMFGDMGPKSGDDSGATAGLESAEHVAELRERAQKVLDKASEDARVVLKHETEGDVDVTLAVAKEEDDPVWPSNTRIGAVGPVLLFDAAAGAMKERPNFRDALAALHGEGKDALAASDAFKASLAAKSGGLKLYFDTGRLMRAEAESGGGGGVEQMLGVAEFGALSARVQLDAKELRVEAQQAWSSKCELAKLLNAWLSGGDSSLFQWVPADASYALALHLDFAKGMDATEAFKKANGMAGEEAPPDAGPGGDPAAAAAGADAPPDARKDFMDHLDGRIALYGAQVDPSEALPFFGGDGPPISFCAVIGVKSAEPLRASIDRSMRMVGLHAARKKSEFQGFQVFSVPVSGVTLHYAILDDVAVISLSPTMLQDVLRRKSDKELKNLAADPGYQREIAGLSPGASLVVWQKVDPTMYGAAGSKVAQMGEELEGPHGAGGDPIDRAVMVLMKAVAAIDPALAAKHLPPGTVLGFGVDANGMHLEGVSR